MFKWFFRAEKRAVPKPSAPGSVRSGTAGEDAAVGNQHSFDVALAHHQAGRLDGAEAAYRAILANDPDNIDAVHFLGVLAYQRGKHVEGRVNTAVLDQVGLTEREVQDMYHVMAIANYEDRFVIPSTHREYAENAFNVRGGCGFSFGNGCSEGVSETSLFGSEKKRTIPIKLEV